MLHRSICRSFGQLPNSMFDTYESYMLFRNWPVEFHINGHGNANVSIHREGLYDVHLVLTPGSM